MAILRDTTNKFTHFLLGYIYVEILQKIISSLYNSGLMSPECSATGAVISVVSVSDPVLTLPCQHKIMDIMGLLGVKTVSFLQDVDNYWARESRGCVW